MADPAIGAKDDWRIGEFANAGNTEGAGTGRGTPTGKFNMKLAGANGSLLLTAFPAFSALPHPGFIQCSLECVRRERLHQMPVVTNSAAFLAVVCGAVATDSYRKSRPV